MSSNDNNNTTPNIKAISTIWEQNFSKLKEFKEHNGHCNIPYSGDKRYLAKWVGRLKNSKRTLSTEQRHKLNSIGFDWRTQREKDDDEWDSLLHRLVEYGEDHFGDYNVPQNYKNDLELGTWVTNQRKIYHRGKMRDDRKEKLNMLGFQWKLRNISKRQDKDDGAYEEKWNEMFHRLKEYKLKYGDCNVPYNFLEDKSLGMWVSTQRRVYRKKTFMYGDEKNMRQHREEMLRSIGFEFELNSANVIKNPGDNNSSLSDSSGLNDKAQIKTNNKDEDCKPCEKITQNKRTELKVNCCTTVNLDDVKECNKKRPTLQKKSAFDANEDLKIFPI